jgi:hypothetical protein
MLSHFVFLSLALHPFLGLGCFFSILILHTVGWTYSLGYQPVARSLPTHKTTQTQNKQTHNPSVCVCRGISPLDCRDTVFSVCLATSCLFLGLLSLTEITFKDVCIVLLWHTKLPINLTMTEVSLIPNSLVYWNAAVVLYL